MWASRFDSRVFHIFILSHTRLGVGRHHHTLCFHHLHASLVKLFIVVVNESSWSDFKRCKENWWISLTLCGMLRCYCLCCCMNSSRHRCCFILSFFILLRQCVCRRFSPIFYCFSQRYTDFFSRSHSCILYSSWRWRRERGRNWIWFAQSPVVDESDEVGWAYHREREWERNREEFSDYFRVSQQPKQWK